MSDDAPIGPVFFQRVGGAIAHWAGITSTLVATVTAIFTTQLAVSVNENNARDRFFEKQFAACTDLGDASGPLQSALSDLGTGYTLAAFEQKDLAKDRSDRSGAQVTATWGDYQKIMTRFFVLFPDSFVPLEGKITAFTPTTLKSRADATANPAAAYQTLRDGFSGADIKLRAACASYLRKYAKANLMNRD